MANPLKPSSDRLEQIMEPYPAQDQGSLFLVWVSLPLIFMGVASLINALVGRKMINGASIYLVFAVAAFAFGGPWRAISNPANTYNHTGDLIGQYTFIFGIPMSIAIYFAIRFNKKKRAEITARQDLRGSLNPSIRNTRTTNEIEPQVTGQGTDPRDGREGLQIAATPSDKPELPPGEPGVNKAATKVREPWPRQDVAAIILAIFVGIGLLLALPYLLGILFDVLSAIGNFSGHIFK